MKERCKINFECGRRCLVQSGGKDLNGELCAGSWRGQHLVNGERTCAGAEPTRPSLYLTNDVQLHSAQIEDSSLGELKKKIQLLLKLILSKTSE